MTREHIFFCTDSSKHEKIMLFSTYTDILTEKKNWIVESLEVYFFPLIPAIAHWPARSATIEQIWLQMQQLNYFILNFLAQKKNRYIDKKYFIQWSPKLGGFIFWDVKTFKLRKTISVKQIPIRYKQNVIWKNCCF